MERIDHLTYPTFMKHSYITLVALVCQLSLMAQWTPVASPPGDFRTDHSFAFVVRDTGYIMVGQSPNGLRADVYRYSAEQDEWTQLPDFLGGTRGYGIGDVWEDKAYFGFGTGTTPGENVETQKNDLWVFDPATNEWTELTPCPCLPRLHPAFVAHQGNIYMGMGRAGGVGNLDDWWQYNIATDTRTQKTDFPSHRRHHPYQFAIGDHVYAGFGHGSDAPEIYDTWYQYDPATDSWQEVANIPGEARVAGTQFSHNGYGYVLSGDGDDHKSMEIGEFWRYDADSDAWEELPPHPGFSRWAPASFVLDHEVYLFNGSSFGEYQEESYKYDLGDPSTSLLPSGDRLSDLQAYPNPFVDQVTIDLGAEGQMNGTPLDVMIYNTEGRLVHGSRQIAPIASIRLGHLPQGSYLLECRTVDGHVATRTLVKGVE